VGDRGGGNHGRARLVAIIAGVMAVAMVVAAMFVLRTPTGRSPAESPGASDAPTAAATGLMFPDWSAGRTDKVVTANIAPGIDRCASRSMGVATQQVAGIGTQFPDTIEGAVAAAANYERFINSPTVVLDDERTQIDPKVSVAPMSDAAAQALRAQFHVDDQARPLDSDGNVVPGVTFASDAYPQYGAYKVWWVNGSALGSDGIDEVYLSWMMPHAQMDYLSGWTAQVYWRVTTWEMVWTDGTFKVASSTTDPSMPPPFHATDPGNASNQTFEWRARLVGPGWCVPADATEQPIPGALKTK